MTGLLTTHASDDLVTDSDGFGDRFRVGHAHRIPAHRHRSAGPAAPLADRERCATPACSPDSSARPSIVDATPAAFRAHVDRRGERERIADQIAASRVDLLFGGGRRWFLPVAAGGARSDGRDLLAASRAAGITVAEGAEGVAAATALPLWALFDAQNLGEVPEHPNVGELTAKALELLSGAAAARGAGFLLVAEEEEIDSAAHNDDLERMTRAVRRFDEAAVAAARFAAARRRDTLVLVLGDHSTGGLVDRQPDSRRRHRAVVWDSDNHAGEPVPVYAYGPPRAAARFTGLHGITAVHDLVAAELGLDAAAATAAPTAP